MSRRLLGIVAAVLLAGVGTFGLVLYVRGAEDRALAGEELTEIYVVRSAVPAGTPATELSNSLEIEQVPVKVRAADAVTDLASLGDKVTAVDLVPGEQLLLGRLVAPEDQAIAGSSDVPAGLVEVTIDLAPTRAVGGTVQPGRLVSVVSSFVPSGDAPTPEAGAVTTSTHIIAQNVLVTKVQPTEAAPEASADGDEVTTAPTANLLVTLAVTPADAERVVFSAEFGTIWLAGENGDLIPGGTQIQTRDSVYDETGVVAR